MLLFVARNNGLRVPLRGAFLSPVLLALYAVPFSFAYANLSTGTGALILFGSVQVTMLAAAVRRGERMRVAQWVGLGLALLGLALLTSPTLATPSLVQAALMAVAGVAWGLYSWRGRESTDPLAATTANFVLASPLAVSVSIAALPWAHVEGNGIVLAVASGAVASGLGYVSWYAALRGLSGAQAAVVQLSVPVLAAAGGVVFLAELVSVRQVLSGALVLGGIALAIVGRERLSRPSAS